MKEAIRRISLTLLLAMFASLIVACGGATDGQVAPGGQPGTGADATPALGPETMGACPATAQGQQITMWSPLTGPDGQFMTQLVNQFNQANDWGIQVTHLAQPEYLQRLNTAAAGQGLPDMTVIRADDIAEMAARNVLQPMGDEAVNAAGGADLAGDFPEQVWNIGEYNDQRYAVPLDVHPLVLYYNRDMFEQAGVAVPTDQPMTREEFEQTVQALNQNGVAGIAIGTGFQAGTLFWTLLRQFGGDVVTEDGSEAVYNSEAGVQALSYLRDLKAQTTPQISGGGDPEVTAFQQGRAAMVIHGPWHISNLERLPFTGFAPVPQIGDQFAVWGGSHQLALTTQDPARQAAAGCWIGWLSQNSLEWARAGQVPIRQSVRAGGDLQNVAPPVAAFAAEAEDVILPPSIPGIGPAVWGEGFGQAVDAVLLGEQADVQAALDAAAARSNQIIQQNQQRYGGQ